MSLEGVLGHEFGDEVFDNGRAIRCSVCTDIFETGVFAGVVGGDVRALELRVGRELFTSLTAAFSRYNAARLGFAGLCVGVTDRRRAGGCTSGHALSGVARLSKRSLVAASIFVIVGMITASVFDTAGAMDVVLMILERTWTWNFFSRRCFTTPDVIVEPWVARVCYAVFVKAKTALTFVLIALPVGSIVAGLYAYYQYINGNDPWEENFERLRADKRDKRQKRKNNAFLDETFHVKNEEENAFLYRYHIAGSFHFVRPRVRVFLPSQPQKPRVLFTRLNYS